MAGPQSPTDGWPPPPKLSFREVVSGSSPPCPTAPLLKEGSVYKGEPALFYSAEKINTLAAPFQLYLVGKFLGDRPSMDFLKKGFSTIGFKGDFNLGLLDSQHVLIRFAQQEDYHRCWMYGSWNFKKHTMKILKWTPDFTPEREPPIVPVWLSFEHLPIHFFQKSPLLSLASLIGKPLKVDVATQNLSQPSVARVCVEIFLEKPLPNRIWIGHGNLGFWQPVVYENLPEYCSTCNRIGHAVGNCGHANVTSAKDFQPKKVWRPKLPSKPSDSPENPSASPDSHDNSKQEPNSKQLDSSKIIPTDSNPNSSGLLPLDKGNIPIDISNSPSNPILVHSNHNKQPEVPPDVQVLDQEPINIFDFPKVSSFSIIDDGMRSQKLTREPHSLSDSEAPADFSQRPRPLVMDEF